MKLPVVAARQRWAAVVIGAILAATFGTNSLGATARSFNGVVASFTIENPRVKLGENLKVKVVYRNVGHNPVEFRVYVADENAELYRKGIARPLVNIYNGEAQYDDLHLQPGESRVFEEVFDLRGWRDVTPGDYEVQFCYNLALLFDESLANTYRQKYHIDGYVIPWEERRHSFTVLK